jgi:hypothetical protein
MRELFDECVQRFNGYYSSAYRIHALPNGHGVSWQLPRKRWIQLNPQSTGAHIVNTETLPSHFLVPAQSAADAAATLVEQNRPFCENPGSFIDWERPVVGEVAQDVAYFTSPTTTYWDSEFMFPKGQVDALVEDYWGRLTADLRAMGLTSGSGHGHDDGAALNHVVLSRACAVQPSGRSHHRKGQGQAAIYLSDEFMRTIAEDCFGR